VITALGPTVETKEEEEDALITPTSTPPATAAPPTISKPRPPSLPLDEDIDAVLIPAVTVRRDAVTGKPTCVVSRKYKRDLSRGGSDECVKSHVAR